MKTFHWIAIASIVICQALYGQVTITSRTEATAPASTDVLLGVDVSDTTESVNGTTKKFQLSNIPKALLAGISNGYLLYNTNSGTFTQGPLYNGSNLFVAGGSGDVNGDGVFTYSGDLAAVSAHLAGTTMLTDERYARADVDGNGVVNWTDMGILSTITPATVPALTTTIRTEAESVSGVSSLGVVGTYGDEIYYLRADVGVRTTSPGGAFQVTTDSASKIAAVIKGASSQTANLLDINSSSGSGGDLLSVSSAGALTVPNGVATVGSTSLSTASFYLKNSTSGSGLIRFDDGSSSGQVVYDHSTDTMTLATGGASRVTVASSGLTSSVNAILSNSGTATELRFKEPSGSGSNYTAFKAQAQAGDVTYTLPAADGTNGYQLTTNGSGTLSWAAAGSGGGLTKFTEAESTSSPNATVYVDSLTAAGVSTNADAAIVPKGTGALLAAVPDSTITGGDKRGTHAVDLQTYRSNSAQVASGANSTIGGGYANTASGGHSLVAGGNTNTASGTYSAVLGGFNNTTGANYSTVNGGANNSTSTGSYSTISGGDTNSVTGGNGTVTGGGNNSVTSSYGTASGYYAQTTLFGEVTQASGRFSTTGDAQTSVLVARNTTTNGLGGTSLRLDGSSERITIPANTAWQADISIVAREAATGDCASWTYTCLITRDGSNNTSIPGSTSNMPVQTDYSGSGSAWTISVTADNTNEALQIGVTGETGKTIKWVARIELTEVTG